MTENKFYTAKYDRVFKTVLCDEDDKELLQEFLSRLLKRKVEIAKSMLEDKVDIEIISKYTDLSKDEIKALK